jgi:hypothetical protein
VRAPREAIPIRFSPLVLIVSFRSLYTGPECWRTASRAFSKRIPSDLGASFWARSRPGSRQLGPYSYNWGSIGLNNSIGTGNWDPQFQLDWPIGNSIQFNSPSSNEGNPLVGFTVLAHGSPERRRGGRNLIPSSIGAKSQN